MRGEGLAPDLLESVEGDSRVGRRQEGPAFFAPEPIPPLPGPIDLGFAAKANLQLFLELKEAVI